MLKKKDLETVLEDYPDAKRILNARARKMINENAEQNKKEMAARNNVIFERRRREDPALLRAVMEAFPRTIKTLRREEHLKF